MERDLVPGPQWMLAIGKNFYTPEIFVEQFAQACASKEIFMPGFEQMPGHHFPVLEIRKDLDIWHGKQCASANDPGDFLKKDVGLIDVLEHLDANGVIKFVIPARKPRRRAVQFSKRQSALREQFEAVIVHLQAEPFVPRFQKPGSIRARPTSHIDDRTSWRQIIENQAER